jgi:hypothetical protein
LKLQTFNQAVDVRIECGIVSPLGSRRSLSAPLSYAGKGAPMARRNRLMPPELIFALVLLSLVLTAWRMLILWGMVRMYVFALILWFLVYPEAYALDPVTPGLRWWLYACALYAIGTSTIVFTISLVIRVPIMIISSFLPQEKPRR